ncbi:MAG: uracil-DNA glycosylase family protein [Methylobacteriaceae bacterium]|nr:uracil-DNA glycosylase family protein [Methylobacteriaceae bacterium]
MTGLSSSSERFAALATAIAACRLCREAPVGAPLPHEPRPVFRATPAARLLVASQAPGTRVHASGLPFDDPSGDRLRDWMGVTRETFYGDPRIGFLPMGFCFPGQDAKGGDLPPRRECAPAWRERALAALPAVECILLVGGYAQTWHLPRAGLARRGERLGETLARWREIYDASTPRLLVLPHPSWRNNALIARLRWFHDEVAPIVRAEVGRALSD